MPYMTTVITRAYGSYMLGHVSCSIAMYYTTFNVVKVICFVAVRD